MGEQRERQDELCLQDPGHHAQIPSQAKSQEHERVEHEKDGVQPTLHRLAQARVDELVLGDEKTRERAERDVNSQRMRAGRRSRHEPAVTGDRGHSIERVPEAFPSR